MHMFRAAALICSCAALLVGQGLNTTQTKDQWEEVNFEFDSAVLSDGYPSLLRLAELLHQNPDYKVRLEGFTDAIGSHRYNDKLSARRAQEVQRFLVKYGANANQISLMPRGKRDPETSNRTKEGRFINRRVIMTVTDGQGRTVSAGGIREAIQAIPQKQAECCDEVLKRLDKLDDILAAVKSLRDENARLRDDLAALKNEQARLQKQVGELPKPPGREEIAQVVETEANKAIEKAKPSRFSLLELNAGPTLTQMLPFEGFQKTGAGNLSLTGRGRYFAPFGKTQTHALQAEGEYRYYRDRQEGQFDLGLVNRYNAFQMGLFSSIKHVNLRDLGNGGTLGQGALTMDYIFSRGRIGAFGTKGYLNDRVLGRKPVEVMPGVQSFNIFDEYFLRIVDQIGASTEVGLWKDAYFDANFGALFRRGGTNRPGGTFRLVQPFNQYWALTVEAGLNETMLGVKNTGRLAVGFQFGNWLRPKEFAEVKHPVPVDIPRVRYELLSRRVRTGNAAPIANAGPDQAGIPAGTATLNGSASYDPDGDPLTYEWAQIAGPTVSITGMNQAVATFPAAAGETYTFRLLVKDPLGAQGTARVSVSTAAPPRVRIVRFTADPTVIRAGQSSTLTWQVENADQVEISTLGSVDSRQGTASVTPGETTTYRLTARNRGSEVSETVTVTVERPAPRIVSFQANPTAITAGQSSTLTWQTENADTVTISEIGSVGQNGSTAVAPTRTTTYTLVAQNRFGRVSAVARVQVTPAAAPTVVKFTATPTQIAPGEKSTLAWQVEGATEVAISEIGRVNPSGSRDVSPTTTTTYTLTASNAAGQTTATATVTVTAPPKPPVQIGSFTANPAVSPSPGAPVVLTWTTSNAASASIAGIGDVPVNGSRTVNPTTDTTYTLTAVGADGKQVTSTVTVKVTQPPPPAEAPTANAGQSFETIVREVTLNGSASRDPNGLPLTYSWRVLSNAASIVNPTSPTPSVILGQMFGDYIFELTVTNSARQSSTATVTVHLVSVRTH